MRKLRKEIVDRQAALEVEEAPTGFQHGGSQQTNQAIQSEGTDDPRILPLTSDFPAINQLYFRQILENKFDPINIAKMCSDVTLSKSTKKSINISKGLEVITGEDDASLSDIKGITHLIRCLLVYWQAVLHFAQPSLFKDLARAFMKYEDRLILPHNTYTWESLLQVHMLFHRTLWYQGVDDPVKWRQSYPDLENTYLVKRDRPLNNLQTRTGFGGYTTNSNSITPRPYPCHRYNTGKDCRDCRYQHVCSNCGRQHPALSCRGNNPNNSNPSSQSRNNPNWTPVNRKD